MSAARHFNCEIFILLSLVNLLLLDLDSTGSAARDARVHEGVGVEVGIGDDTGTAAMRTDVLRRTTCLLRFAARLGESEQLVKQSHAFLLWE
jgi:hypothetical protein